MMKFYHRFIPWAAHLMRPMYGAAVVKTSKHVITWSEDMLKVFSDTKVAYSPDYAGSPGA